MATTDNPLLAPSTLPYGIPDYAAIRTEHYVPAFTAAAAHQLQEISAITRARSVPTFENTIEAWERTGEMFDYAESAIFTVSSADSSPEIQAIEEELAPLYSAHIDAIMLDEFLYSRVKSLFDSRDERDYTPEQRYLIERRYAEMTHAGAALDEEAKTRLKELNARLATLTTTFEKNLLGDANRLAPIFTDITDLDGLSAGELDAAAAAAKERGEEGYMLALPLFTGHPALASLTNRETREKVMAASRERGTAGEFSNNEVLLEIVRLRAERAELLGYASHAAYITSDETAGSPEAVHTRLKQLAPAAARNAAAEQAALQELINASESTPFELAAHDWAYYTEKVRADRYNVDTASMRPWFESERVLHDGVFFAATQLYGITFTERDDLHAYHPDARVFEVFNEDGSALGLFILDMYTRDSKRGGAWMNHLASQSHLRGTKAVVLNNLNVPKPASGPTLLTLDEVGTLFHEFGHALHGLFAVVTYPHFAGTNVFRDFVEFPSQVNEMWIMWPAVLSNYARQLDSGEPLDPELVARMDASETFNQGFGTSEYLAAAWLDQAWHSLSAAEAAAVTDVAEFEAKALAEIGLDNPAVPTRYASTYFSHIFAGGYSAGYYSYIWSEVLDADTVEWFKENGGLVRENGDRFRQRLLGVGGSKDPLEAYRDFRGRDADIAPLLKRRGLDG